jgi:hypothetical protein
MRHRRDQKEIKSPSAACCDCFISPSAARNSIQLSEVYCPCHDDHHHIIDSPACLTTISKQRPSDQVKNLLNVESEIEYSKNFNKKLVLKKSPAKGKGKNGKGEQEEYEIACEAADADEIVSCDDAESVKIGIMTESDKKHMIRVNGKEELPCVDGKDEKKKANNRSVLFLKKSPKKTRKNNKSIKSSSQCASNNINNNNNDDNVNTDTDNEPSACAGNEQKDESSDGNNNCDENVKYSTLPMANKQRHKRAIAIPQRITADGTKIFYVCDLPKKMKKGSYSHA